MFETLTIDVTNVKKILKCCPYYDDIINSDIMYNDDLSIDLIEWYKDIIFSCNGDNEEDIKIIRNIDRCMYIYIKSASKAIGRSGAGETGLPGSNIKGAWYIS